MIRKDLVCEILKINLLNTPTINLKTFIEVIVILYFILCFNLTSISQKYILEHWKGGLINPEYFSLSLFIRSSYNKTDK